MVKCFELFFGHLGVCSVWYHGQRTRWHLEGGVGRPDGSFPSRINLVWILFTSSERTISHMLFLSTSRKRTSLQRFSATQLLWILIWCLIYCRFIHSMEGGGASLPTISEVDKNRESLITARSGLVVSILGFLGDLLVHLFEGCWFYFTFCLCWFVGLYFSIALKGKLPMGISSSTLSSLLVHSIERSCSQPSASSCQPSISTGMGTNTWTFWQRRRKETVVEVWRRKVTDKFHCDWSWNKQWSRNRYGLWFGYSDPSSW